MSASSHTTAYTTAIILTHFDSSLQFIASYPEQCCNSPPNLSNSRLQQPAFRTFSQSYPVEDQAYRFARKSIYRVNNRSIEIAENEEAECVPWCYLLVKTWIMDVVLSRYITRIAGPSNNSSRRSFPSPG
ncbi:hypothetical protein PAXINDRAFT_20220 [Paxillus involutus ATCC 200175]|uniref:Unplaced genomic scaffold PAXINscaffold_932, whole genome shotgun sequence n=1 Tax=Paxillus involutus ATCC 200175 TaxID=664439 RepID=A0A0C9TH44_PAXIN|nr:hypothetical protein PAXINDRAFT_20220 [Paxillus involutus ATCC 200175]